MILPPLFIQFFSISEDTETLTDSPHGILQHCETKKYRRNFLMFPFLSITIFTTGTVLKRSTEGFPYQSFRHQETNFFSTETLILSPPPAQLYKLFHYPKLMKHSRIPPYGIIQHFETKNIRRKFLTYHCEA